MNQNLIDAIAKHYRPEMPVWQPDLRKLVSMSKKAFDDAIIELAKSGRYFLNRHHHPAQSSAEELAGFVPDRAPEIILWSSCSVIPKPYHLKSPHQNRPGNRWQPQRQAGADHGQGQGDQQLRKRFGVRLNARLPRWLADWLKSEKDIGRKIEQALIEKYNLTPPT